jgi:molecular chaperone GrpE
LEKENKTGCPEAEESPPAAEPETEGSDTAAADKPADGFFEKWQRTLAEFDNFRKRTAREKAVMYDDGVSAAAAALLPVMDNLERALASAPEKSGALYEGLEKVLKQAAEALGALGVEEIDALGKTFDANLHDGVMRVDDETLGEHVVAEVFQKGYIMKGRVIRHSMVKVAN